MLTAQGHRTTKHTLRILLPVSDTKQQTTSTGMFAALDNPVDTTKQKQPIINIS